MIKEELAQRYGNTIYPTMVITGREPRMKMCWLSSVNKHFRDLCRLHGSEFKRIAANNPRKIESIIMDDVRYYFVTERWRQGFENFYIFIFVYTIHTKIESELSDINFAKVIYDACNVPQVSTMCPASLELSEFVRERNKAFNFSVDFMSNKLLKFAEEKKIKYLYKANDLIGYVIDNYFNDELSPCRIKVNRFESEMLTSLDSIYFTYFVMNLFLVLSKYSLRTIEVDFENNLETLHVFIKCQFHNRFFGDGTIENTDVILGDSCDFTAGHPAFMDFEFLKRLANFLGAAIKFKFDKLNKGIVEIIISKTDKNFENQLRAGPLTDEVPDITVYEVDLSELI